MRRLDGVTHVSLNTVDQAANVFLEDAEEFDFAAVANAADSAAFLVKSIGFNTRGQVLQADCEVCDEQHVVLEIEETGQQFHLALETAVWDAARPFSANVPDWNDPQPTLELVE